jgi:hypothetical protein
LGGRASDIAAVTGQKRESDCRRAGLREESDIPLLNYTRIGLDTRPLMVYTGIMDGRWADSPDPVEMTSWSVRYCGRTFSAQDFKTIRGIASDPQRYPHRSAIAQGVCEALSWYRPDGRPKAMSARVALLRMERDGLLELPPPLTRNGNGRTRPQATRASDPGVPLLCSRGDLDALHLERVEKRTDSLLWNELVERYHYLGYKPLPGAQMRYLIADGERVLGVVGLSASAWKVASRDRFIGWSPARRETHLHLVVNNSRFLILPWVRVRNLASSVLAMVVRRVADDWQEVYGYQPVLMETFVEENRFSGACYRAANWIYVGRTEGRGKLDRHKLRVLPVKSVFLYPLRKNFRRLLSADDTTSEEDGR